MIYYSAKWLHNTHTVSSNHSPLHASVWTKEIWGSNTEKTKPYKAILHGSSALTWSLHHYTHAHHKRNLAVSKFLGVYKWYLYITQILIYLCSEVCSFRLEYIVHISNLSLNYYHDDLPQPSWAIFSPCNRGLEVTAFTGFLSIASILNSNLYQNIVAHSRHDFGMCQLLYKIKASTKVSSQLNDSKVMTSFPLCSSSSKWMKHRGCQHFLPLGLAIQIMWLPKSLDKSPHCPLFLEIPKSRIRPAIK